MTKKELIEALAAYPDDVEILVRGFPYPPNSDVKHGCDIEPVWAVEPRRYEKQADGRFKCTSVFLNTD